MESENIKRQIEDIEREIAILPAGSIAKKTINGNDYYYHRVKVNKKRTETYIDFNQVDMMKQLIKERKKLEVVLKDLKAKLPMVEANEEAFRQKCMKENISIPEVYTNRAFTAEFRTNVRIGEQLENFAAPVKDFKKRECFAKLQDYIYGDYPDKVFILYGLRRTGKTTLIRQMILNIQPEERSKAVFIQVKSTDTLRDINADLKLLEQQGYKYVFIDEVTLMKDFIEGAALFSDIYASSGMKIVLSGTDSLGFVFTKYEELYDRCILLHTTFIPYREFEQVLGIKGIDEYIRYGGTMSMGGKNYNMDSAFASKTRTNEYIDSAIARNIQHSLEFYKDGTHFRNLYELYENGELTSAINRVIEDINHRFTKQVLTRPFKSNDIPITARNMLRDKQEPIDILDNIDEDLVNKLLKALLEILDVQEQTVSIDKVHADEIREYLALLDLIIEIDQMYCLDLRHGDKITAISQPGMRYAQAEALVKSLLLDPKFNQLSINEREVVISRLLSEIKGRMMEDIVLLETKLAHPNKEVFQLKFAVGEFDMVIHDPKTLTCQIFEIKYSKEVVSNQYRHLIDNEKCSETEHRFGRITDKIVIYRGDGAVSDGVQYINVETYLNSLA
jgi:AAA+ ATPase superfamily predicted ATPase